jgi:hypothetical protein
MNTTLMRNAATRSGVPSLTALPMTANLFIYAGDDFYVDLIVVNSDGTSTDLSSATAKAQIRAKPTDPDPALASFTATISSNVIHLHLPSAQSTGLVGTLVWDCQITYPDVVTLVAGTVSVTPEVTR